MPTPPTIHLLSLGCPKNRVDSEVMLGHLANAGYAPVSRADDADVIVVNTCAFIDAAKEESVDAILEMGELRKTGRAKKLIVAGCLSQRYAPELAREIPEIDAFVGTGNFEQIGKVVGQGAKSSLPIIGQMSSSPTGTRREHGNHLPQPLHHHSRNQLVPYRHNVRLRERHVRIPDPDYTITAASPRLLTSPAYTTYVKIAEGCSNTCAFCIIPKLRGPQRSRTIEDIITEVIRLWDRGVVEINLIAQDLCAYGKDLHPQPSLARLLRALDRAAGRVDHPVWIRCLYAYPRGLTQEVIRVLAAAHHIVPYLDMPLQHISTEILRRMRRGKGGATTRNLLRRLRDAIGSLTLRTTFIAGLPGETEREVDELLELIEEVRFERMGVFTFSPEEDTLAAEMPDQVDPEVAAERRDRLLAAQRSISHGQQEAFVGRTIDVLVEGVSEETDLLLQGRHVGQAPEIDGLTYITSGTASPGEIVRVHIEQAADYDLAGQIVESQPLQWID